MTAEPIARPVFFLATDLANRMIAGLPPIPDSARQRDELVANLYDWLQTYLREGRDLPDAAEEEKLIAAFREVALGPPVRVREELAKIWQSLKTGW